MTRGLAAGLAVLLLGGCSTLGYYHQAASGHWQVMSARQPIAAIIADPETPDLLVQRLTYVQSLRVFARDELSLPDSGNYSDYADIGRPYVVWNVFAAPEFDLKPVESCFPLIGCVAYRGFYAEAEARQHAATLAAQANDVYVGGVAAYSTLGWFDDPLLNTMLRWDDARLAEVLFHELAHTVVYAPDDTAFNESFATAVQREGFRRWVKRPEATPAQQHWLSRFTEEDMERDQVLRIFGELRTALARLYQEAIPDDKKRMQKQALFEQARTQYRELYPEPGAYSGWFSGRLNNAQLVAFGAYQNRVQAFENLITASGGDLPCVYSAVADAARLSPADREEWLNDWEANTAPKPDCAGE